MFHIYRTDRIDSKPETFLYEANIETPEQVQEIMFDLWAEDPGVAERYWVVDADTGKIVTSLVMKPFVVKPLSSTGREVGSYIRFASQRLAEDAIEEWRPFRMGSRRPPKAVFVHDRISEEVHICSYDWKGKGDLPL